MTLSLTRRAGRAALGLALGLLLIACSSAPGPDVQVLVSTGQSAPAASQKAYAGMLQGQVLRALPAGTRLQLAPIDYRAFTAAPVTIDLPADNLLTRPTGLEERRAGAKRTEAVQAALNQFRSRPAGPGTEIIGAVQAAAGRFQAAPGRRKLLVLLTTGFEQSELFNLYDTRLDLQQQATIDGLLERARAAHAVPDLQGVTVCVAGITNGDDNAAPLRLVSGIERWWRTYFAATGAQLAGYGGGLDSCPLGG